jgi:hypothetical protein
MNRLPFTLSAALLLLLPACSKSPAVPVMAVGKVGQGLTSFASDVPQGMTVCAYKRALDDPRGKEKESALEACKAEGKSDELWRRAMGVLAAYGDNISEIGAREGKTDLREAVKIAAPHVKTICTGLDAYLERQKRDLADLQKKVEEARVAPTSRRCAMLDNRSICVSDSASDALGYADALTQVTLLESRHAQAQTSMKAFCAAHATLAQAAEDGNLKDDKTYDAIVDAVRASGKK